MSDFNGGKVVKRITAPAIYNVPNDVDIVEVDTTSGLPTIIILQPIAISDTRSTVYISDVGDNASVGKITVQGSGGNTINGTPSIDLEVDGIIAEISIADRNRFIANLSTDDSTPPVPPINDKNFVMQQVAPVVSWSVPHNLDKKCAVQVTDNANKEIECEVIWNNLNQVTLNFNKPTSGWVYCN